MSRRISASLLRPRSSFGSPDFQVPDSGGWCEGGSNLRLACSDQGDRTSILPRLGSKIACSLTNLLRKERKWEWDAECQAAFQKLKDVRSP